MTEFTHCEVLFAGDDGLPLEFNIQNTVEKDTLKAIIEHGGGMCTLSDDAIYLVSPGTKVLSVGSNKKLISSLYVFDCVKEDCLLDTDEYRIEIHEMETSDFSDNSANLCEKQHNNGKPLDYNADNSIDIISPNKNVSPDLINSNHAFDFKNNEGRINSVVSNQKAESRNSHIVIPLKSTETHIHFSTIMEQKKVPETHVNAVPDSLEDCEQLINIAQNPLNAEACSIEAKSTSIDNRNDDPVSSIEDLPVNAVVSSSQESGDQFDNMVLSKIQERRAENDDDSLSQSYTVSSSADAQISPKPPSHHTSAEIFDGSSVAPDSASQPTERQQYIRNLEKEIELILKKPSPKSIQDKIVLVKYVSVVQKLAPAIVLQSLQKSTYIRKQT